MAGLLIVNVCGAVAMGALTELQRRSANDAMQDLSLEAQAESLLAHMRFDPAGRLVGMSIPDRWREAYRVPEAAFYTLYDRAGRAMLRSPNLPTPLVPASLAAGQPRSKVELSAARRLELTARAPRGYRLVVARTLPGRFNQLFPDTLADLQPLILFLGVLSLGVVSAWWVVGWSLRPLARASHEAGRIGPDHLQDRLTLAGLPAEVAPLAEAVNGALDRVARAYDNERRFMANAAHALRTPIAVMDLRLQRAAAGDLQDLDRLRADLKDLALLVSGLLNLARVEARPESARVNLARTLREAAAGLQPAFANEGRSLAVEAPDSLVVIADPRGLRDALDALIDNALIHGAGAVTAKAGIRDGFVVVVVGDEGLGVVPDHQDAVFDRFTKLDANARGAGLGLSIVREMARSGGGEARFRAPAEIEVRFPLPSVSL